MDGVFQVEDKRAWPVANAGDVQHVQHGRGRGSEIDPTFGQVPECLTK